jgi:hypothetical protein
MSLREHKFGYVAKFYWIYAISNDETNFIFSVYRNAKSWFLLCLGICNRLNTMSLAGLILMSYSLGSHLKANVRVNTQDNLFECHLWILYATFREDQCRVRAGYAVESLATFGYIALKLETLCDPLTHLIRNCGDHGLGETEERLDANKDRVGHVLLKAY